MKSRIFAIFTSLCLLLNSLLLPVSVFAQEIVLEEPSPSPSQLPDVTMPTPLPMQPPVVLGKVYTAEENDKVSVMFTKLPDNAGIVSIKEVKLTKEQIVQTGALSDTAYEITSTMENETFEYTLTLPIPTTQNVEVKYSEDGEDFVDVTGETVQQDTISVSGLTHFTIFVVVGTIDDVNDEVDEEFDESSSQVLINEFIFNPSSGNEWIELYNTTGDEVDFDDWQLCEQTGGGNENCTSLTNSVVSPNGFVVEEFSFARLNNAGDTINLRDDEREIISQVSYDSDDDIDGAIDVGTVAAGQSVGRTRDAGGNWDSFPTPTKESSNHASLYVDRDFDGDEYGTFNHPFTSIQDAFDKVLVGGTVNVASGEYEKNLRIEKSLTLLGDPGDDEIGPGDNAPTIYGECTGDGEPVISVEANNVTVSGFIVIEDGCDGSNIYVSSEASGATISDNELRNASYYGVELGSGSSDNQILRNLIYDNDDYGIYNYGSSNATISGNDIYNNYGGIGNGGSGDISGTQITNNNIHENYSTGIYVGSATFSELTISNNDSIDSNQGYGIYFDAVTDATLTISGNSITNNSSSGIYLSGGCTSCITNSTVTISGNTISSNTGDGIYADVITDSTFKVIDNNTIEENTGNGIYICAEGECVNSTVTIDGNEINDNDQAGIYLYEILDGSTVSITENDIQGNGEQSLRTGIYINYVYNSTLDISANDILENIGDGIHIVKIEEGTAEPEEEAESLVTISENTVDANTGYGVYISEVDAESDVTIGEDNTITDNTDAGIYLNSGVNGVSITGNTITGNGLGTVTTGIVTYSSEGNEAHNNTISGNNTGIANFDTEGAFDARKNYWGAQSGPEDEDSNPDGEGNGIEGTVSYRPFYTDNTLETLSTLNIDPSDLGDLVNTGVFSLPEGESSDSVTVVTVEEELTLTVDDDGNQSSVTLPVGTTITRSDGSPLDAGELTADDVDESSLSGLGTGTVVDGALQWGIPNLGLTFSQPITLNIFVGTGLNGQTLNIQRSVDGVTWTNDGIEPPKTCFVASGICTFQATKASFYATTHTAASTTSTSSSSGGESATTPAGAPVCGDIKPASAPTLLSTVAGTNSVTLTWTKAADPATYYLVTYGDGPGLQQYGNPSVGGANVTTYTVAGLSGGTTYYFRVRAGNGCAPGDYSNEVSATPGGGFITGLAPGFIPGVLSAETTEEGTTTQGEIKGEEAVATPSPIPEKAASNSGNIFSLFGDFVKGIFSFLGGLLGL